MSRFELRITTKHSKTTWIDMNFFITLARLQGEHNQTNLIENEHWMKKIQAPEVVAIKWSLVNSN